MNLTYLLKRLGFGLILVLLAAAILLYSDKDNRIAKKPDGDTKAQGNSAVPGKIYKIGIAYFAPEDGVESVFKGLFDGLKKYGFVKDSNLQVVMKHANGEIPLFPQLLQSLDNMGLDLILPMSTPCIAASCNSVKKTPVVLSYCYDPIAAGAGKSFTEHLPFITGVGSMPPVERTSDFIKVLIPGVKTIGTIYNSSEANSRKVVEEARIAFKKAGIKLEEVTVTNTNEVFQAAQVITSKDIQALWITGDNTCIQAFDAIGKVAEKARLPLIINDPEFINKGATAAVGIGWYQTGLKTAEYAARVLTGENPKDIPICNFVQETIILNKPQALKIGLVFTPEAIKFAEEVNKIKFDKKLKLYILEYSDSPNSDDCVNGIMDGLKNAGLAEGKDFDMTIRNAQGDIATLNNIVDDAISTNNDLLFSLSTPTLQVVSKKIKTTPVVVTNTADPVAAGAGKTFADHQPNITGICTMSDFEGMVKFLRSLKPAIKKVGTIFTPAEINSVIYKDKLVEAGKKYGIEVVEVAVYQSSDVSNAADVLCSKGIDAVCQISDNLTNSAFSSIASSAQKAKIPVFVFITQPPKDGTAVAAVARDYYDCGLQATEFALRILQGENPAGIPFTFPKKAKIIINKKIAKKYGIIIPKEILDSADEVIN